MLKNCMVFFNISFLFVFIACQENSIKQNPDAKGKVGQILLVVENEILNNHVGDTLRSVLQEKIPTLTQIEPLFDVTVVNPENFTELLREKQTIVIINVSDTLKYKGYISTESDTWAKGQLIMRINAFSARELLHLISKNRNKIQRTLVEFETELLRNSISQKLNKKISSDLAKTFHINLLVPEKYKIVSKKDSSYIWLKYEEENLIQNLIVYSQPYRDSAQLSTISLDSYRESLYEVIAPKSKDSTWRASFHEEPALHNVLNYKDHYAIEMRGIWNVLNDFRTGPFINLSVLDYKRKRIITIEGIVYAPAYNKREYLRQFEAIIYSLNLL